MKNAIIWCAAYIIVAACSKKTATNPPGPVAAKDTTFTNPLLSSGPDPWVFQKDTMYYYTQTLGNRVAIYSTSRMSALNQATVTTIWSPPSNAMYSSNIWAPEIHYLQGKWYVYFAADNGDNRNHRMWVLENPSPDPLKGTWTLKGKLSDATDKWAIDGSVFEYNGQLYCIWSGWPGDVDVRQDLYVAKMKDPFTIEGSRVMISTPSYPWEGTGTPVVNEGPEAIKNSNGKLFVVFSANHCSTDNYALALLTLKDAGDPLKPADWTKSTLPVFTSKPEYGVYGPGHNGFFKSRDGQEDWMIYHANSLANQGCSDARNPRMQRFTWNADGSPNFGTPVQISQKIRKPSGE